MQHWANCFRKRWLGLLVTIGLAAGVLALMWLSVQADTLLASMDLTTSSKKAEAKLASAPQASTSSTETVYLPLVLYNFAPPAPVFGVEMRPISDEAGLEEAAQAGVHWVRFHGFQWGEIEPFHTDPPTYNWTAVDEDSLLNARANGMEVIGIIFGTPSWAQKYPGSYCGPIREDMLDEYAQFLTELVNRYSLLPYNVRFWEMGNEPDVDLAQVGPTVGYGCWGDMDDDYYGGGYYAEMLKAAYPAIKAADPHAQVLIGGLLLDCDPNNPPAGKDCKSSKFLEGILRDGGGPYFDTVGIHAYTYYGGALGEMSNSNWSDSATAVPEKVAFVRDVLDQYGYGDKAVMNTEAALLCWSETNNDCFETQAMYLPRVYAEALALGLPGQIYYAMINEEWRHTGLLLPDLTPRPAYYAYEAAASFLHPVRYEGEASGYPSGIAGYSFRRNDTMEQVDVIWSSDGSLQDVTLPSGASAYSRYGNLIASSGVIQVGSSPVYIIMP
jgi:hypothetical protein